MAEVEAPEFVVCRDDANVCRWYELADPEHEEPFDRRIGRRAICVWEFALGQWCVCYDYRRVGNRLDAKRAEFSDEGSAKIFALQVWCSRREKK